MARVRVLVVLLASLGAGGSALGIAGSAAGSASCSTPPTLQRVNAHFTGDPNQYSVQLSGDCAGIIGKPLYYFSLTSPAGKQIIGVNSDSNPSLPPTCGGGACQPAPGCSSLGNSGAGSVTCNAEYNEPDGIICAQFALSPDAVSGDQFSVQLLDSNFNPIPGTSSTQALPTDTVAQCTGSASPSPPSPKPTSGGGGYACSSGPQVKVYDNSNIFGVFNGAKPAAFSTKGKAYCVTSITTYHWNNGTGATPGSIGLGVISGAGGAGKVLGPFKAAGSSGQGGAPNVNWTVTIPTIKMVVIKGTYSCKDSSPATWSQNQGTGGRGFCIVYGVPATGGPAPAASYACTGPQFKLFDNSNVGGVSGGGTPPSFSTNSQSLCVRSITTYHWNNGTGATPGTIGLGVVSGLGGAGNVLGPFQATGSSGQGGATNVNWTANLGSLAAVVINGTYTCQDSSQATWSQNQGTGGRGFCIVYVTKAVPAAKGKKPTKPGKKPAKPGKPKPGKPKPPAKRAKCKQGKLGIAAAPDTGKPPLAVTFALCSPKVVQWRIDYGDGQSKVAIGSPPSSITHTYQFEGDFRPTLTVLAAPNAPNASSASTSVSVHQAQLISLSASPPSGPAPLRVTFALGTTVKNITTWSIDFGDGQRTGGGGKPPASVAHTYAKDGNYKVTFAVKPGSGNAVVATFAQVTVGAGNPPILSLTASPASGAHPLAVTFTTQVNIPGQIVSWQLRFGDGQTAGGQGKPPSTVHHTYSRKGTFAAFLIVAQQQRYGGVQYTYPRGGLGILVR